MGGPCEQHRHSAAHQANARRPCCRHGTAAATTTHTVTRGLQTLAWMPRGAIRYSLPHDPQKRDGGRDNDARAAAAQVGHARRLQLPQRQQSSPSTLSFGSFANCMGTYSAPASASPPAAALSMAASSPPPGAPARPCSLSWQVAGRCCCRAALQQDVQMPYVRALSQRTSEGRWLLTTCACMRRHQR